MNINVQKLKKGKNRVKKSENLSKNWYKFQTVKRSENASEKRQEGQQEGRVGRRRRRQEVGGEDEETPGKAYPIRSNLHKDLFTQSD
jgi:hypothetical protein